MHEVFILCLATILPTPLLFGESAFCGCEYIGGSAPANNQDILMVKRCGCGLAWVNGFGCSKTGVASSNPGIQKIIIKSN